jgi:LacI family transcriptional regulator
VAARAGVSVATVDRVINGRGGVQRATADKVARALEEMLALSHRPDPAAKLRRIDVLLPARSGRSTEVLADALEACADGLVASLNVSLVERFNPRALADELLACRQRGSDGIAFQGVDHPEVRDAMDQIARAGIPLVTLCSDVGQERLAYVGIDNRAAGRAAGWLMGRFCRDAGKLAVVWGGQLYRSHEERETGFRAVLRHEHPELQILDMVNGNDDSETNHLRLKEVIAANPELRGVYCVGGGQSGVARALDDGGLTGKVVMIGHNFNEETRPFLLSGTIAALIHQDMDRIARAAIDCLLGRQPAATGTMIPVEIITRENMPLR